MVKVGVIGCGHWGPNHIRILSGHPQAKVVMCADSSEDRLKAIKGLYPEIIAVKDYKELLNSPDVQAVCIATPTNTHFTIAKEALENGKHVLCEKPLAMAVEECQELKDLAAKKKKILMVGH